MKLEEENWLIPTAVNANVDPKVAEFCLKAADFAGCVKTMTTKSTDIPSMRLIEGAKELSGNSCPSGFAYSGAGMCREVISKFTGVLNIRHVALLSAGYAARDHGFLGGSDELIFGQSTKAVFDPKCPDKEPFLYRNSSCESKLLPIPLKQLKKIVRGLKKKDLPGWDAALFEIFGVPFLATEAKTGSSPSRAFDSYFNDGSNSNKKENTGTIKINCDSPVWKNKPRCN